MKILQGFLIFMGALAVIAIIALLVGYVMALLTPDIRSSMRPVLLSAESVDSLNNKLSELKKEAAAIGSSQPAKNMQLTITNYFLTTRRLGQK